jgi:Glycosyltransferase family 87
MTPRPDRSSGTSVESTAGRPRFVSRTEVVAFIIGAGLVMVADKWLLSLPLRLGSDWDWYRDGPFRLAAGLPLYDASMLGGPFNYLTGPLVWNQAPWALAVVAPFALLPDAIQMPAWLLFTDCALLVGLALTWPKSTTPVFLFIATITALSAPFLMGMSWGNLQSVAALGIGLFMFGYRKRSDALMGVGIAVAATKLIPALPLVAFVVLRARRWRPLFVSGILLGVAMIPVLIVRPTALSDFALVALNMDSLRTTYNLSPALWLTGGIWLVRAVVLVLGAAAIRFVRSDDALQVILLGLACLLVQNLYADWFVMPLLGLLNWQKGRHGLSTVAL